MRAVLFWLGCILTRVALVVLAATAPLVAAVPALAMGVGITTVYVLGLRKQAEEAGGPAWWDHLRPYHGALLILGGALAARKSRWAPVPLGADVALAITAWLWKRAS